MTLRQARAIDVQAIVTFVERTFTHETVDDVRMVADTVWRILCRMLDRDDLHEEPEDGGAETRSLAIDTMIARHPEWVVPRPPGTGVDVSE